MITSLFDMYLCFSKDASGSRLENDDANSVPEVDMDDYVPAPETPSVKLDKSTQRPMLPEIPYKNQCERGQREIRGEIIDTLRQAALKAVHFEETDLSKLLFNF